MGFETLFEKLGIKQDEHPKFYKLFDRVLEYFQDMNIENKVLQKFILSSYLSDPDEFNEICNRIVQIEGPLIRMCNQPRQSFDPQKIQALLSQNVENQMRTSKVIKELIQMQMHPLLIPYGEFHDEETK